MVRCYGTRNAGVCCKRDADVMAELQTSFLTRDAILYQDERERIFGQVIPDQVQPGSRTAGMFKSIAQGVPEIGINWQRDQWGSLKDKALDRDQQNLTPEIYDELINDPVMGKLDVPFQPGITVRQFRNQIRRHKSQQYLNTYNRSVAGHIGLFIGGMGGGITAPEILSTIWVGGPLAAAAVRAGTTMQGMRLATGAGAQISAVSTPANIWAQQQVYANVDPMEVYMTAVAPFVFTPAGVAFGRAFTPKEQMAAADAAATPLPSPTREPPDDFVPVDFREEFSAYSGGVERWIDDIAQNNPAAFEYGRTIGFTDDALSLLKERTFVQASKTAATKDELLDLDALEAFATSDFITREQLARLERRGLMEQAEIVRAAEETPAFLQTIDQRLARQAVQERRASVEARFPELRDALRYRDYVRGGARAFDEMPINARTAEARTRPPAPNARLRETADAILRAVRERDSSGVPEELRPLVRQLTEVAALDRGTRQVAYRQENQMLDLIARVAAGDVRAQNKFAERALIGLPENAEGDYRAFRRNGLEGVRARFLEREVERANELTARLGILEEAQKGRRGRPSKKHAAAKKELKEQIKFLNELIDDLRARTTKAPEKFDVDELAYILNTSRLNRGESPMPNAARERVLTARTHEDSQPNTQGFEAGNENVTDAQLDDILNFARRHGVEEAAIDNEFTAAVRAITECEI